MKCIYCNSLLGTGDVGGICRACKEKFKDADLFLYKREHTLRAKAEYELAIYKKAFENVVVELEDSLNNDGYILKCTKKQYIQEQLEKAKKEINK